MPNILVNVSFPFFLQFCGTPNKTTQKSIPGLFAPKCPGNSHSSGILCHLLQAFKPRHWGWLAVLVKHAGLPILKSWSFSWPNVSTHGFENGLVPIYWRVCSPFEFRLCILLTLKAFNNPLNILSFLYFSLIKWRQLDGRRPRKKCQ